MRLVLLCTDVVAQRMAGPGIRYWELAHALADRHDVTLIAPGIDLSSSKVRLLERSSISLSAALKGADAAMCQILTPGLVTTARRHKTRLVFDAYVPSPLEALQQERGDPLPQRRLHASTILAAQQLSLVSADAVVCASERQRDLWMGALMAAGRLTPQEYDSDPTLRSLVDVVPFGLPSTPPTRDGGGPRGRFGLPDDAVLALWGGGLWEWFDPLTVVRAHLEARREVPQLHLAFLGLSHPTNVGHYASDAAMDKQLRSAGSDSGIIAPGEWVPYSERASWLLDADLGVSANFELAEGRYAFRTRVLDYLWAGLPCLLTEGDSMADLVTRQGVGQALPPRSVEAWTEALVRWATDVEARRCASAAARTVATQYTWPHVAERLERVFEAVLKSAPSRLRLSQLGSSIRWGVSGSAAAALRLGPRGAISRLRS